MTKKLTANEMKVEIAKDVLAQLKAKRFVAERGTYFEAMGWGGYGKYDEDLSRKDTQAELRELEKCRVCAIGAVFASAVDLYDGVSTRVWDIGEGKDSRAAQKWFEEWELQRMEAVFELHTPPYDRYGRLSVWDMDGLSTSDFRMKVIMRSIIRNKGEVDQKDMVERITKHCLSVKRRREAKVTV